MARQPKRQIATLPYNLDDMTYGVNFSTSIAYVQTHLRKDQITKVCPRVTIHFPSILLHRRANMANTVSKGHVVARSDIQIPNLITDRAIE
jgi:hypothetical protein